MVIANPIISSFQEDLIEIKQNLQDLKEGQREIISTLQLVLSLLRKGREEFKVITSHVYNNHEPRISNLETTSSI